MNNPTYEELVAEVTRLTSENASLETHIACNEADMKACANLINSQSKQITELVAQVERLRDFSMIAMKSIRTYGEHPLIEYAFQNASSETPSEALDALKDQWLEELEVVGWQFKDGDGKWYTGMNANNHKENTINDGYQVRNVYAIKGEVE